MDVLVSHASLVNLADVAEQFSGRTKCECNRTGLEKRPKYYMKIGYPGGERYWCEECTNVPPDAVYLNNTYCRMKGCKRSTVYALIGTRYDGLCGPHHKKILEEDQALYENVHNKRCACGNFAVNAIVPVDETHKTTSPTHCGMCVRALPEEVRAKYGDVVSKRCERDGCEKFASYAEDFNGFPVKFCGPHAPKHFVLTSMKPCRGPDDGTGCTRNNIIGKSKPGGQCALCGQNGYARSYEIAVLDRLRVKYGITDQYKIYDAVDVVERKRSRYLHAIDGVILFDGIVIAIEVDEKGSHHQKEDDERRMRICDEYLKEEHGVDVAWIRIAPNIRGGKKVLGDGNNQFSEKAIAIREEIVDRADAAIEKLIENPESGVFKFEQKSL